MSDGLEISLLATKFFLNEFGTFSPNIFHIYESYASVLHLLARTCPPDIQKKKDKIAPTEFNHPNTHQNTLSSYFFYSFKMNMK